MTSGKTTRWHSKVQIPLDVLKQFVVSLPLTSYVSAPAPNGQALVKRVLVKRVLVSCQLPRGWSVATNFCPCTTLFKVQCTNEQPEARIEFLLVINNNFTWALTVNSTPVLPSTIPAIPSMLHHGQHLTRLIHILDNSKMCNGNPDKKYVSHIESHHGNLRNKTGTCTCTQLTHYYPDIVIPIYPLLHNQEQK